jgi:hypothetical protein
MNEWMTGERADWKQLGYPGPVSPPPQRPKPITPLGLAGIRR